MHISAPATVTLLKQNSYLLLGLCESDRMLVADKKAGAFLTICPEYCFVCENTADGSIVAFALTAPDATQFFTRLNVAWLPEMRLKYPRKGIDVSEDAMSMMTPIEEMMFSFHLEEETTGPPPCLPSAASSGGTGIIPWGLINLCVTTTLITDQSVSKRLTMLAMACLRASGTVRAYTELQSSLTKHRDLFTSLGFTMVNPGGVGGVALESSSLTDSTVSSSAESLAKTIFFTRSF
jgi:protein O-GlcNAcase/histone acetyltransferase